MAVAKDIQGTVFRNATATFMARVENSTGQNIDQISISAVKYTVYELTMNDPQATTAVVGHENVSLSVGNVIYDTLQNDPTWTVDQVGYNFRHELDISQNEAFALAGAVYQVRYELTPVLGQKIVFRFQLKCI
ncbi:MAG: hypothetical protein MI725_04955 [Pirellulales bacterium]|nr:hypothetical protein [Pirellulales bacterium]